jgi:hypothetical protein
VKVTPRDHGVEVVFRSRRGFRWRPAVEILWPDRRLDDPSSHGTEAVLGIAVLGVLFAVVLGAAVAFPDGLAPIWRAMSAFLLMAAPFSIPLLLALRKTRIEVRRVPLYREHTLRLDPGGVRLDGRPSEVWLAGHRLVTGDGAMVEVAEAQSELRRLDRLLSAGVPGARERLGDRRDVPSGLRAVRGAVPSTATG